MTTPSVPVALILNVLSNAIIEGKQGEQNAVEEAAVEVVAEEVTEEVVADEAAQEAEATEE